jgi:hypothetical protein
MKHKKLEKTKNIFIKEKQGLTSLKIALRSLKEQEPNRKDNEVLKLVIHSL